MINLAHEINEHLTDEWTITSDSSKYLGLRATLTSGDRHLCIENGNRDPKRLNICGLVTHPGWLKLHWTNASPKITVAKIRGPKVIAKEIERRLLPKYKIFCDHLRARYETYQAEINAEADAMGLIAEVVHSEVPKRPEWQTASNGITSVHFGRYNDYTWVYGSAEKFYDGRLDIHLRKLTPQEAATVLEALIEIRKLQNIIAT